jgi:hypothetical protein
MRIITNFLIPISILFLSGCQTSTNDRDFINNNSLLIWGKAKLISAISETNVFNDSLIINNLQIKIHSDGGTLPEKAQFPEGFHINIEGKKIAITGFDAAGAMYGCLALAKHIKIVGAIPKNFQFTDAPVMKLRGTCILLMKLGTYNYPISPETFPFFYDKKLWLEYLDFLAENRYNYIAFWNGHPFDYFVKLEKYPEAQSGMGEELIEKNYRMLSWLCEEGQKRNIKFLFQFYNIHTSVYFQRAHNLPNGISAPTPLLEDYTGYTIETFVRAFPQVGLYITPGEAIDIQYTDSWINEVIFPAIGRTGKTPPVFVRSWGFDLDHAREIVDHYPELYFERKFNVEMIADTVSDPENRLWADLNGNFIVNIHMAANLEPMRWNPPSYIQKCMQNAYKNGANGLHLYPRKSWRWPFGSDSDTSQYQWVRDDLWFEMWGRYAWNPFYEQEKESLYWQNRLSDKFGSEDAASLFLSSFEAGADVLPALQRLIWLGHDNHTVMSAGAKLSQLETSDGIPFLKMRNTMRIPAFLNSLKKGENIGSKNPLDFLQNKRLDGARSYNLAKSAAEMATKNKEIAQSFYNDALITYHIIDFYIYKLHALKYKTLYEKNIKPVENKKKFLDHLELSLLAFRKITDLTSKSYESLSDVPAKHPEKLKMCPYHWRDILPIYEKEYKIYQNDSKKIHDESFFKPSLTGLAGIWYSDPGLKNPDNSMPVSKIDFDWSDKTDDFGRNWSAQWFGYIISVKSGVFEIECESDRGVTIKTGEKILLSWRDVADIKTIQLDLEKNVPFPIQIIYDHAGGNKGYLRCTLVRNESSQQIKPQLQFYHSPAQEQKMDRIAILRE